MFMVALLGWGADLLEFAFHTAIRAVELDLFWDQLKP